MTAEPLVAAEALALQRAMPLTRLLDCGMDYADALALHTRSSGGEPWHAVAEALADNQILRAQAALASRQNVTAHQALSCGIAALVFAQMAINADTEGKRALYRRLTEAGRALAAMPGSGLERIETEFDGRSLVGWLQRPATGNAIGTVITFGGQSGWGLAYLPIARALAVRGMATLLAEGPGQGESRIEQGIFLDVDVTAAYRRFVDLVHDDASLGPVGVWGNSVGGLWAAACAAADHRVKACCINSSFAAPRLLSFRTFVEQAGAMLGTDDEDRIQRNFERMRFEPGRDRIPCPVLVLHGGADPLVTMPDQQPFLDAAAPSLRTLRIWPDGEHTIYNHSNERTSFVADWFAGQLAG